MMLKQLEKCLASEKDENIVDIVLYGSAARQDDARDVDILVILKDGSLRERLEHLTRIKAKVKAVLTGRMLDIKQIALPEFFSPAFMARQGVLLDGVSLRDGVPFCERLGFKSFALFSYSLKGLSHAQKVKFNYVLAGRGGVGMLERVVGQRLAAGAAKVPRQAAAVFEEILMRNKVVYTRSDILEVK
jgi:predicted nucleotidyltransferase